MEQTQRSNEYVFQGVMYFFRKEKNCCRYQFTLRDAIDPLLLQQALDAALQAAPYFQVQLVWEGRSAYLEPNTAPCPVYAGRTRRQIPEQTNGYLFSVSFEDRTVYFDWFHFIADGHGIAPFWTRVLEEYCSRRYGVTFDQAPIPSSPAYDIRAMVAQYPEQAADETTMQRDVLQTYEGKVCPTRIRFTKQSLVQRAVECGVKPVSALMALLCLGLGRYLNKDEIRYSFSADTRDVAGVPDARYNCVCSYQHAAILSDQPRLTDIVAKIDASLREDILPENKRRRMAEQMGWVYKVDQQKAPLRIKQRVFQMGEYISGVPADYWISYLGNPLMPATPELERYIEDFQVWVMPDGASMGVEASSLNGIISLCIQNKAPQTDLSAALRQAFEAEGIEVLDAVELDEV